MQIFGIHFILNMQNIIFMFRINSCLLFERKNMHFLCDLANDFVHI